MNKCFTSVVCSIATLGMCTGTVASALDIDNSSNAVFDLYYFGSGEVGYRGSYNTSSGVVKDSTTYYWSEDLKQAMQNAVNTWTEAIATPYDLESNSRKLRIGFFLDDGSNGGIMNPAMAGYSETYWVATNSDPQYGSVANMYSIAEWAWRENNETAYYYPSWARYEYYWESNLLPSGSNNVDIVIVLNPVVPVYDGSGLKTGEIARSIEEMQNVATHEIGHGMGMESKLYRQVSTGAEGAVVSGYMTTWDTLLTLDKETVAVMVGDMKVQTEYDNLAELHAAAWEPIPENPEDRTFTEIQYDPERQLSIAGEVPVHVSALALPGDTIVHLNYEDGLNVLGPGGTANGEFSESDLRALELLGWSVNRNVLVPEPTTATMSLLALAALAARRRRK